MKAYKGFKRDMTCRGFQYEEGKTYVEEKAELCKSGFHACENPLDTFGYYSPGESVYHEVELDDVSDERTEEDTKVCAKKIKIGAKLDVAGICKAHFVFVTSKCTPANGVLAGDNESAAAGDKGSAAAGNYGSAAAGGYGLACARGGKVKGGSGAVICSTETDVFGENISFAAGIVDGVNIKEDTWYKCIDGKLVEA